MAGSGKREAALERRHARLAAERSAASRTQTAQPKAAPTGVADRACTWRRRPAERRRGRRATAPGAWMRSTRPPPRGERCRRPSRARPWVPVEHALDPDAVDVLRAHDDHVRGAVEDRQVAVAVDLDEVVRAEPAVGRDGLGRRLDVVAAAGEERRAADPDLADALARRGAEAVLLDAVHDADAGGRAAAAPIEARPAVVVRELARLDGPQGADAVAVARHGSNVSTMEKPIGGEIDAIGISPGFGGVGENTLRAELPHALWRAGFKLGVR